jgi:hypothetical protein
LGKPLISDAAMRSMFSTMQHLRTLKRDAQFTRALPGNDRALALAQPESLPAALLQQVHRRDTVVTQGFDPLATATLMAYFADGSPKVHNFPGSAEETAAFAAGVARSRSPKEDSIGKNPVVIGILRSFPSMTATLQTMEKHSLALLLVVQAEAEARVDAERRMRSTKVPILPVDATDAVAVCRVTQESMLRARNGWGGAVIHAISMPGSSDPIDGMEQRLRARGLLAEE